MACMCVGSPAARLLGGGAARVGMPGVQLSCLTQARQAAGTGQEASHSLQCPSRLEISDGGASGTTGGGPGTAQVELPAPQGDGKAAERRDDEGGREGRDPAVAAGAGGAGAAEGVGRGGRQRGAVPRRGVLDGVAARVVEDGGGGVVGVGGPEGNGALGAVEGGVGADVVAVVDGEEEPVAGREVGLRDVDALAVQVDDDLDGK